MGKPNLFEIGTKELSQDAFITWLLRWADDSCKKFDKDLNACGKAFVSELIKKQYPDFSEEITKVEAKRQEKDIDIWAVVNDKYLIIIEDKTNSGQHSKQLERYKEIAEKWCVENNKKAPICIYLKTGNESIASLNAIVNKGYHLFSRIDFINLFSPFECIENDIFKDFKERMQQLEKWTSNFNNIEINKWGWYDWQGFYMGIEKDLGNPNWEHQNGKGARFWKMWFNAEKAGEYPLFIQLENTKLCFKVSTSPYDKVNITDEERENVRKEFYHLLLEKAKERNYDIKIKPNNRKVGKWMTFAIVEQKDWLGEDKVNIDEVVKKLNQYLAFLREFIKEYNQK